MNTHNQITLPPIQHVLQGLFKNNDHQKPHQRRSSFGYDSTVEAARSLQKMSTAGSLASFPSYPSMQFNRTHRRTVSASIEIPMHPPMHVQQQAIPFPTRRARAHTTSGYPPTMLFDPTIPHRVQQEQPATHRYHCQHCSKSFSRPSSLRIHIYSHTGEKPFRCNHQGCGRSFSVHSNMRRHLRVHYCPPKDQQQQQQQISTSMRLPIIPTQQQERDLIRVLL